MKAIRTADLPNRKIFALIIGINQYKTRPLRGSVNDANNFREYLVDTFNLPNSYMRMLIDQTATRAAIIETFQSFLINNPDISYEDPIVIFFAGHGSRVPAPPGWESSGGQIETICPVDEGRTLDGIVTPGIPDITLNILLDQLADEKGTNIVVILDSCHSGGATRESNDMTARSLQVQYDYKAFPDTELQQQHIPCRGLYKRRDSHILLAACRQNEKAYEIRRGDISNGNFTTSLVQQLREKATSTTTTYRNLISSLPLLSNQNPQCYGLFANRFLFDTKSLQDELSLHPLNNFKFQVELGTVLGATRNSTFSVLHKGREIGSLVVVALDLTKAVLAYPTGTPPFDIPDDAYAVPDPSETDTIQVFPDPNSPSPLNTDQIFAEGRLFRQVMARSDANVAISVSERTLEGKSSQNLNVERLDPLFSYFRSTVALSLRTLEDIRLILDSIAYFLYHLSRNHISETPLKSLSTPGQDGTFDGFKIDFYQLDLSTHGFRIEKWLVQCDDRNRIKIQDTDSEAIYGIRITNRTTQDVYPYLFFFDGNDYTIMNLYHPLESGDPPLKGTRHSENSITIGYGAGGGNALSFAPGESGFLKLIVSSRYVDFRSLERNDIRQGRLGVISTPVDIDIWGSWLLAVTVAD